MTLHQNIKVEAAIKHLHHASTILHKRLVDKGFPKSKVQISFNYWAEQIDFNYMLFVRKDSATLADNWIFGTIRAADEAKEEAIKASDAASAWIDKLKSDQELALENVVSAMSRAMEQAKEIGLDVAPEDTIAAQVMANMRAVMDNLSSNILEDLRGVETPTEEKG